MSDANEELRVKSISPLTKGLLIVKYCLPLNHWSHKRLDKLTYIRQIIFWHFDISNQPHIYHYEEQLILDE